MGQDEVIPVCYFIYLFICVRLTSPAFAALAIVLAVTFVLVIDLDIDKGDPDKPPLQMLTTSTTKTP